MSAALLSLLVPLFTALLLLLLRLRAGGLVIAANALSLGLAVMALSTVVSTGTQQLNLGGWDAPLGIRFELGPLTASLLVFTALVHLLVAVYAERSRHSQTRDTDFWPLSCLLHTSLAALWLSRDLFNWYVTLELLGLVAVAMVILSGPKAHAPALRYLLLSLAASLCYLLGVALIYGQYGVLDIRLLADMVTDDRVTRLALLLLTLGLMLKAALWPLHQWLPAAHASAPTAVSALLSALVVKGPLFILWMLWDNLAPVELARQAGVFFAVAGIAALISGGWAALRTPWIKVLVAYSTVAQLGYALLALGLLLHWQDPTLSTALWLFVIAHGLAKVSMFLAAGEMQATLGSRKVSALKGASQTMPIAMFAFAVAGGSLVGLPPSGGFVAKWVLLQPLFSQPSHWPWALGVLLGTLASAAYVFRVVAIAFDRADPNRPDYDPDTSAQWLAMLPALVVWAMALMSEPVIRWFGEAGL
ncbi:complex I subunit 5 family protein [Halopseudomonas salina]|uniref:Cation:proton antiporter n=1 Tax=Halopseudomonas salina TaxID=1323744 RepID=A0ABQ1P686_9GAMM|nr:proton-conducting transporter membrane subunit [Halopseudomonas salina]GGC91671.1 cation:proton antiporter [Halopseudomonas salina]